MSCIYIASQHDQVSSVVLAVCKQISKLEVDKFYQQSKHKAESYLRKVTLVTYHEVYQTSKVVPQEFRSSPNKCGL